MADPEIGHLDGVHGGELSGWALDRENPGRPLEMILVVQGVPLQTAMAVHLRTDVAAIHNTSGLHGFFFDLARLPFRTGPLVAEVQFPSGKPVDNSPIVVDSLDYKPPRHPHTVLFMHIPRTGGTALREAIATNYRQSEVAYLYPEAPGMPVHDLSQLPLIQRANLRCVMGHFRFGIDHCLPGRCDYVTLMRDPVERVLSQYFFRVENLPGVLSDAGRLLSLPEVLERRLTPEFDNYMVRYFAGVSDDDYPAGTLDEGVYKRALHNLRTRFRFVGLLEELADSYSTMARLFGWEKGSLKVTNHGVRTADASDPHVVRAAVEKFNLLDIRLYRTHCLAGQFVHWRGPRLSR